MVWAHFTGVKQGICMLKNSASIMSYVGSAHVQSPSLALNPPELMFEF